MQPIQGAPAELNSMLKEVYESALKTYDGDEEMASKTAYSAAEKAGWYKGKDDKWQKRKKVEKSITNVSFEKLGFGIDELNKSIHKREDVNPQRGKEEYGDVEFADERNKKYPINDEGHIRAAWNYINKEKNAAEYPAEDVAKIKAKIIAAWKKKIDKAGPPSAIRKSFLFNLFKSKKHEVIIPKIGDKMMMDGKEYIFLESTPGEPKWHSPEEVDNLVEKSENIDPLSLSITQKIIEEKKKEKEDHKQSSDPSDDPSMEIKEPWQMTREEFEEAKNNGEDVSGWNNSNDRSLYEDLIKRVDFLEKEETGGRRERAKILRDAAQAIIDIWDEKHDHQSQIKQAISEGKNVPADVLNDYKDTIKKDINTPKVIAKSMSAEGDNTNSNIESSTGNWEKGEKRSFAFDPNSTENEGRFRLLPPDAIQKDSYFRTKSKTDGISFVKGKLIGSDKIVYQAIRFDKNIIPEDEAAKWWEKNKSKFKPGWDVITKPEDQK